MSDAPRPPAMPGDPRAAAVTQLLARATALAGRRVQTLAQELRLDVPADLRREKGWLGQLLEQALGAQAGSKPEPDFPELGVELKTLPVSGNGQVRESTFVCVAQLARGGLPDWEHSLVRAKLQCVLWLPVEDDDRLTLGERRIGHAFLWQPDASQRERLRADYEEHAERIALGEVEQISAHHGDVLQLRPKGANRQVRTDAIGPDGTRIQTLPRGFYLRRAFTQSLLDAALI